MNIDKEIVAEMKKSVKTNPFRLNELRALKSDLKNYALNKGSLNFVLSEADVIQVIRKRVKQHQDSIEQFKRGNRSDLIDKEKLEMEVLTEFLPAELSQEEILAIVDEAFTTTGATQKKQMGAVMTVAQKLAAGRVDGKILSGLIAVRLV